MTEFGSSIDLWLIAEHLERDGYIVLRAPLLKELAAKLLLRCQDDDHGRFHAAQIGRGAAKKRIGTIRGDVICWLDSHHSVDQAFLAWMEELRVGLNAALFLGLYDYECHYAIYASGACYARHSDVLAGARNRVLSTVYYLNESWQASDGGELLLFGQDDDEVIATVNPEFGTMIIFLSESFPHQVLAASKSRRSIVGWFRVRDMA